MITPPFSKTLLELLPHPAQLLYGLVKGGGIEIDKDNKTITVTTPYPYDLEIIQYYLDQIDKYENEYGEAVRAANDEFAKIPDNEQNYLNEIRKVLNQIITILR